MDPKNNPFNPHAGAQPPALVGRGALIERFEIALARIKAGRAAKSLVPTGLRGVGKTVLLNQFVESAQREDYLVAYIESDENGGFIEMLAGQLHELLLSLSISANVTDRMKRAVRVLKSFSIRAGLDGLSLSLDIDPERGSADTGNLNLDLRALLIAIGEAAQDAGSGLLLAVDEVQYLSEKEFNALIMALHRTVQLGLPVLMAATGLPQVPALAGSAKSYAERLFDFPIVGALNEADAKRAIEEPAEQEGARFEPEALDALFRITRGYPFFIQEWAYHVWNYASQSPITVNDVHGAEKAALESLDESFFRVRFDRLTDREKSYLRAMAELGPGTHSSGEIAAILNLSSASVGTLRETLIKKGMIYSPQHAKTAFSVPLFDAFMRRAIPSLD